MSAFRDAAIRVSFSDTWGGGAAVALASCRPPPSQQTLPRLTDSQKEEFGDNTIDADGDMWSNALWESESTVRVETNSK